MSTESIKIQGIVTPKNGRLVYVPIFPPLCQVKACHNAAIGSFLQEGEHAWVCEHHLNAVRKDSTVAGIKVVATMSDTSWQDLDLPSALGKVPRIGDVGYNDVENHRGRKSSVSADPLLVKELAGLDL